MNNSLITFYTATRKFMSLILFLSCFIPVTGQVIEYEWHKQFGGPGIDENVRLVMDPNGTIYLGHCFEKSINLEINQSKTGITSLGGLDILVYQIDSTGNITSSLHIGGKGSESLSEIYLDHSNLLYISGTYQDTLWMISDSAKTKLLSTKAITASFFACFDSYWNMIWIKDISTQYEKSFVAKTQTTEQGFITAGKFMYRKEPETKRKRLEGGYISIIQNDKTEIFTIQGKGNVAVTGFTHIGSNIIITGYFEKEFNWGTHKHKSMGNKDMFIASIDSTGHINDLAVMKSKKDVIPVKIRKKDNRIYLMAGFGERLMLNNQIIAESEGSKDIIFIEFDPKLNIQDYIHIGGKYRDQAFGFHVQDQTFYMFSNHPVAFSGLTKSKDVIRRSGFASKGEAMILTVSPDKGLEPFYSITEGWLTNLSSIQMNHTGDIYFAGSFYHDITVEEKILQSKGLKDIYLVKLTDICKKMKMDLQDHLFICPGDTAVIEAGDYVSYQWSTGQNKSSIIVTQPGQYFVTVRTPEGCLLADTVQVGQIPVEDYLIKVSGGLVNEPSFFSLDFTNETEHTGEISYLWDFGDNSEISSESNPVHYYNTTGAYVITVNTSLKSYCMQQDTTVFKVMENKDFEDLKNYICTISPNPFKNSVDLQINLPEPAYLLINLNDVSGDQIKVLIDNNLDTGIYDYHFILSELNSGVYLVDVVADGEEKDFRKIFKVIKMK